VKKKPAAPAVAEQPGCVQSRAWLGDPLSVQEIRRRLWRMVLAVQQTAPQILAWSHWCRGHQRLATHDHDQKRGLAVVA
jgi:hypothetical protein